MKDRLGCSLFILFYFILFYLIHQCNQLMIDLSFVIVHVVVYLSCDLTI